MSVDFAQKYGVAPMLDLADLIKNAKLGRTRKDAQEDTCAVFAAALYDALSALEIPCRMITVSCGFSSSPEWYHAVLEFNGRYYDSMGEFSEAIWRKRAKIHPSVRLISLYRPDTRADCYETEFDELHHFYLKAINKAFKGVGVSGHNGR
ncbi:MAG: hypothetical protein ACR2PC_02690 [Tsuneonella suprasediminis]